MRKAFVILMALVLNSGLSIPAYAQLQKDRDFYVGKIISVDAEKKEIIIFDFNSRIERTFTVERGWENAEMNKEVMVNVLQGTKIAKVLREILPKKKP